MSRLGPSEYGSAGSPPDAARDGRRAGISERAGNTGGYARPDRSDDSVDPMDLLYEMDRLDAMRSALSDDA